MALLSAKSKPSGGAELLHQKRKELHISQEPLKVSLSKTVIYIKLAHSCITLPPVILFSFVTRKEAAATL
jgi:hypothetical protein